MKMFQDLIKIKKVISKKDQLRLFALGFTKFISGFFDMIGVASIAPFIIVVTNKEVLKSNEITLQIKEFFKLNDNEMIVFFAFFSITLIILNQSIRIFSFWFEEYVCNTVWFNIHKELFKYYINQPFSYHIQTNSNSLLEKIQVRANAAVAGVINPFFQILGHFFVLLFLAILLIITNPSVALILLGVTASFYFLFFLKLKKKLVSYGQFSPEFSVKTFKLVEQAFKSIKDIIIKDNSNYYTNLFNPLAKKYALNQVKLHFFSFMPKNILEIFAYSSGFGLVIYLLISESKNFSEVAVVLGIYAVTLQKLLPAVQGAFQSIAQFKYHKPSLEVIYEDLVNSKKNSEKKEKIEKTENYNFNDKIIFKDLKFSYPNSNKEVLNIKNLEIKKGTFLGVTGKSGSGKSTFVDLLTGLLTPSGGELYLDGKKIDLNLNKKLQSCIGYVPQFAFVADDTIKNNIALGYDDNQIDFERVKKAAEIADISEFINKELPLGYETIIGEDGIMLSGGQRQRISIARAIYNFPQILIFDEATNSLDNITENQIIKALLEFNQIKTIIMVTHRIPTLKICDDILFFNDGKLAGKGDYFQLINENSQFKDIEKKNLTENYEQ